MELSRRASVSYSTLHGIDAGKARGRLTTRFRLSSALGDKTFKLWPDDRAEMRELRRMLNG